MGVKFSQLPNATQVAADDYIAVLDTSEGVLKKTPISHASTSTIYGVASSTNYGHSKVIDNLNKTASTTSEALSAHQGNVLSNDIGTAETGDTAAHAHAAGEYFMWKGTFVQVTSAIVAGNTIAIGTNVTATSVAASLAQLSKSVGFVGTTSEYNAAKAAGKISEGMIVTITDDGGSNSDIQADLNLAMLTNNTRRWLRFDPDNRKGLIIKAGSSVKLNNGSYMSWGVDTKIDFSSSINNNGTDYFVYCDNDGNITCSTSSYKADATKIGRFHTLCVDAGTLTMIAPSSGITVGDRYLVKQYDPDKDPDFYAFYNKTVSSVTNQSAYDVATMPHPLSGFRAQDILPESVFCTTFHPECIVEDAMVYDKDTNMCIDIYLQSGTCQNTRSRYGAVHTVSRTPHNHREDMRMVGKKLLTDSDFTSAAIGSNERTAINGAKDWTTVGGHIDTSNRRMISAIGCEEMCGYLWQWLDEVAPTGTSGWQTTDTHASFGQEYGNPYVLGAGGSWAVSSSCGSRARYSYGSRSNVSASHGGRGSSRVALIP